VYVTFGTRESQLSPPNTEHVSGHSHHCWQCGKQRGKEAYPTTEELQNQTPDKRQALILAPETNHYKMAVIQEAGLETQCMDNRHFMTSVSWLSCDVMFHAFLALLPGLLQLQFLICSMQKKGRSPGESYYMIQGTADIMDSRVQQLIHILIHSFKKD